MGFGTLGIVNDGYYLAINSYLTFDGFSSYTKSCQEVCLTVTNEDGLRIMDAPLELEEDSKSINDKLKEINLGSNENSHPTCMSSL